MKKIAVIMATYNGSKFINEQIDSIINQVGVEVTIFCFDDRSSDDTFEKSLKYASEFNVIVVKNEKSTGSAARNFIQALNILDECEKKFDFVAFSDQDDVWLPKKLSSGVHRLELSKSDLYMSNLTIWRGRDKKNVTLKKSFKQKKYDYLFEGGSAGCTYLFSWVFFKHLNLTLSKINFDGWNFLSHDWLIYFFARINNYLVFIDNNSYILYRIHESNVHGQLNVLSLHAIKERLKMIKNGWYFKQIKGFSELTSQESIENKIHHLYSKNYCSRLYVLLRYNFELMRSPKKFIQFFIISLLPIRVNK
jgi:rhamnosyltransferase